MNTASELYDVARWRYHQLEQARFPAPLARLLACDRRVDLHAVIELAERGCPPHLAVRIVAPLDERTEGAG